MQQRTQEDIIESEISLFHGDQTQVYKCVTENVHLLTERVSQTQTDVIKDVTSFLSHSDVKDYILDGKLLKLKIPEI